MQVLLALAQVLLATPAAAAETAASATSLGPPGGAAAVALSARREAQKPLLHALEAGSVDAALHVCVLLPLLSALGLAS
jgi:hypothetical protein